VIYHEGQSHHVPGGRVLAVRSKCLRDMALELDIDGVDMSTHSGVVCYTSSSYCTSLRHTLRTGGVVEQTQVPPGKANVSREIV
jgi:hypothetical protein